MERPVSTGHKGDKVTNRFGYDECLKLCADLSSEVIIVVNFRDGVLRKKPLEEATRHAASLLAYCNAPVGAQLPQGMEDWPAIRAKNGHAKPYGVKYVQIGNETWFWWNRIQKLAPDDPYSDYIDCVSAYIDALRAVDPSVQIIMDSVPAEMSDLAIKRLGDSVQYFSTHTYLPWDAREVSKDGDKIPLDQLTAKEIWQAWVAMPEAADELGQSIIEDALHRKWRENGHKLAVTEWNWNGG